MEDKVTLANKTLVYDITYKGKEYRMIENEDTNIGYASVEITDENGEEITDVRLRDEIHDLVSNCEDEYGT